ncbi:conserved hypothetical protein [Candida tropicalis MYA-3404]|uniref:Mitochondrial outer membrane protein OM14 C-terminal domain-containing protein n=1 Tax=Candida tropicalis (strain ATCC MYA-3404 / T1) TaxID=294747 RepID=C5MEF3_CANTT|nr:conserved hypothetical protein [Candida tropicalis MYA-3404]EER31663.1 conserved hypothetical protein [Candida tropicalis MYA-3404]KAG4405242.1 hypothetical protein JTP64_005278 [Candida tropicalis]MCP8717045.1 hypothetical protein [Asgard group archaeon]
MSSSNEPAPSNEQIKKDLKKDAKNIEKKVAQESENLKEQGKEKANELSAKGQEKANELSAKGQEFFDEASAKGKEFLEEANDKSKEFLEEAKKELNHLEEEGKDLLSKFVKWVKATSRSVGQSLNKTANEVSKVTSQAVSRTSVELQNPVVVTQLAVVAGGLSAGYLGYLERHRINTDNKYVVGLHASIITGLVLLDGYLFNTYYPKYDKKTTRVEKATK